MDDNKSNVIETLAGNPGLEVKLTNYLKELFGVEISKPSLLLIFKNCDINILPLELWPESDAPMSLEMQMEIWFFMRFVGRTPAFDNTTLSIQSSEADVLASAILDGNWKRNLNDPHQLGFKATEDVSDELDAAQ